MVSTERTEQVFSDARAYKALASPHRLEIVAALGQVGPASIADLARVLGRTVHSLYYHVKLLEESGIVVSTGTRRKGRRDEKIWKIAAMKILLGALPGETAPPVSSARAIDSMMRLSARELQRAVADPELMTEEAGTIYGVRMKGRLSRKTIERVNELIEKIESLVRGSDEQSDDSEVYALTIVMTPTGKLKRREWS